MEENKNKTFTWFRERVEFIITILVIVVTFAAAWTSLQAKVAGQETAISEIQSQQTSLRSEMIDELRKTNDLLNNSEYGLAAIHQRLKHLEE